MEVFDQKPKHSFDMMIALTAKGSPIVLQIILKGSINVDTKFLGNLSLVVKTVFADYVFYLSLLN